MNKGMISSAALFVLLVCCGQSQAQIGVNNGVGFGGTGGRAISPFVGLSAPNGALNYFANIRPQLEIRALMNRQQQEINDLARRNQGRKSKERDPLSQEDFTLPRTGHRVYFSTYSHYYLPPQQRR